MASIAQRIWHNQKFRYLLVGGYNTAFGYGVFALLWWQLNQELHYIVLLTISHILAVTNAYLGYRHFVFKTQGRWLKEYLRFNLVYLGSFIFNLISLPFIIEHFKIHPLVAQAVILSVTVVINYVVHKRVTFKKAKEMHELTKKNPSRNVTRKRKK